LRPFFSVLDPDPHGSALILVSWIRIQELKNVPQKLKKVKKFFMFLSAGCSLLRAEGFSYSLDVRIL
jgi:hypothetical protein